MLKYFDFSAEELLANVTRFEMPYDIHTFDQDDRFRLCCSVFNVVSDHVHADYRDSAKVLSMPENRMFNINVENWVKLRFEHHGLHKGDSVRAKMMTCTLSTYSFYLVADANALGSVFLVLHSGGVFSELSDLSVAAYVTSVPMLQHYRE